MDDSKLVKQTEESIRTGLRDYFAHTSLTSVYDDVSDEFIERLARDAVAAKHDLREICRRSPAWNESLQALVINGTRTHNPDYEVVSKLAHQILDGMKSHKDEQYPLIQRAIRFFDNSDRETGIAAINALAPDAYKPKKKISRVFKALCDELGVTDNTPGSEFQQLFAQIADEMNSKKIDFKLFVSINPSHFLTMSNPKDDMRGEMLTSCHSFNSNDSQYVVGCSGYARDNVTCIAFTVDNPDNPELLNNRKTMRQLFMHRVGSGLILQSRLYNTCGGTYGVQKDMALYRDLVQREISECEGIPNLWKTGKYCGNRYGVTLNSGYGFGGYRDWIYSNFDSRISVHENRLADFEAFEIGTYGLCVCCASEIYEENYCEECLPSHRSVCDECGERCSELRQAYGSDGELYSVCSVCLEAYYYRCAYCGEYHHGDNTTLIKDDVPVCNNCLEEHCEQCDGCGQYYPIEDDVLRMVHDPNNNEIYVCGNCYDARYEECEHCGETYHNWCMNTVHDENGDEIRVCEHCLKEMHEESDDE